MPVPSGPTRQLHGIEPLPEPELPPRSIRPPFGYGAEHSQVHDTRITVRRTSSRWVAPPHLGGTRLFVGAVQVRWTRQWANGDVPLLWTLVHVHVLGMFWDVASFAPDADRPGVWSPGERTYYSTDGLPGWLTLLIDDNAPPQ